jgi:hypothetical protein
VPEHDDRSGAGAIVVGAEVTAQDRLDADQRKAVPRHERALESLGGVVLVGDVHRLLVGCADAVERRDRRAPVAHVEIRGADGGLLRAIALKHPDLDDAVGLGERQVAQERAVDQGEHEHVHRDADRKRCDGGQGEAPVFHQQPRAVLEVSPPCHRRAAMTPR